MLDRLLRQRLTRSLSFDTTSEPARSQSPVSSAVRLAHGRFRNLKQKAENIKTIPIFTISRCQN